MKTNIYIDAFNLYYGSLRNTLYKWLDPSALCRVMLPRDDVHRIKYFTALVEPRHWDPGQRARQQGYLRALGTLQNLTVHLGHFLSHRISMPTATNPSKFVAVIKTEEKGSDVNIATELLVDVFHDDFEAAVVISNDSDFLAPIRAVRREFGKVVGILNPQKHPSAVLIGKLTSSRQSVRLRSDAVSFRKRSGIRADHSISRRSGKQLDALHKWPSLAVLRIGTRPCFVYNARMPKVADTARPFPALVLEQRHADAFLAALDPAGTPSLLFTGPEGTGKEYTAIEFARRVVCPEKTLCDLGKNPCQSCQMVTRLEHPGIHLIYPTPTQGSNEGDDGDVSDVSKVLEEKRRDIFARYRFPKKASIRIARARAAIQRAYTKPFDSPYHVFILIDAHAMREEAQNALLKLVEEPPPHAIVIFTTTNPEGILYTIRSRCQRIRFSPLKPAVVERILAGYYGMDAHTARRASVLGQGSITRARDAAESFDDSQSNQAMALVAGLALEPESWAITQALQVGKGSNREGVARFLDEVSLAFRDVMTGDPALYVNQELTKEIQSIAPHYPRKKLPVVIDQLAEARAQILLGNMNIDATLTDLFLKIHRSRQVT